MDGVCVKRRNSVVQDSTHEKNPQGPRWAEERKAFRGFTRYCKVWLLLKALEQRKEERSGGWVERFRVPHASKIVGALD